MFIFRNDGGNVYFWIKEIEQFMKKNFTLPKRLEISLNNLEMTTSIIVEMRAREKAVTCKHC